MFCYYWRAPFPSSFFLPLFFWLVLAFFFPFSFFLSRAEIGRQGKKLWCGFVAIEIESRSQKNYDKQNKIIIKSLGTQKKKNPSHTAQADVKNTEECLADNQGGV